MTEQERTTYWWKRAKAAEEKLFRMEQHPVWVKHLEDEVFDEMD